MPVSFTETISNWPRKAGNHVPDEKGSILCEHASCAWCAKALAVQHQPQDISEMQEPGESLHSAAELMEEERPACPDLWCFTGRQKMQETQLWNFFFLREFFSSQAAAFPPERHLKFFHFSVSPKARSRAEVDTPGSCFSTSYFH